MISACSTRELLELPLSNRLYRRGGTGGIKHWRQMGDASACKPAGTPGLNMNSLLGKSCMQQAPSWPACKPSVESSMNSAYGKAYVDCTLDHQTLIKSNQLGTSWTHELA